MPLEYPLQPVNFNMIGGFFVDANMIRGVFIDDSNKANGKVLKYNSAANKIVYATDISASGGSENILSSRIVFFEAFVGNGIATTFTLNGNIGNGLFTAGGWVVANTLNTAAADVTNTSDAPIYTTNNIFTRVRISVVSVSAVTGDVVLSDIPQVAQAFRIYYWYNLDPADVIEDYFRTDNVTEMENSGGEIAAAISTNVANFDGAFKNIETDVQTVLDRIDDYTYVPQWDTGKIYRTDNIVVHNNFLYQSSDDHIAGATFAGDSAHWSGVGALYLDELFDVDITGAAQGSILFKNAAGDWTFLAPGNDGYFLQTKGAGEDPQWGISSGAPTSAVLWNTSFNDVTAVAGNGYITTNNVSIVAVTLPVAPTVGQTVRVSGAGIDGWRVKQPANTTINFGVTSTTTGIAGYLEYTQQFDAVELLCISSGGGNYIWSVVSSVGNIVVV